LNGESKPGGLGRRLGWFVLLWAAGVAVLAVIGMLIKLAIGTA
jgi:hypothetical protein